MLNSGAIDDALDFAREANVEADRMMAPRVSATPRKVAVKKKTVNR
jgi:hypothetical protein